MTRKTITFVKFGSKFLPVDFGNQVDFSSQNKWKIFSKNHADFKENSQKRSKLSKNLYAYSVLLRSKLTGVNTPPALIIARMEMMLFNGSLRCGTQWSIFEKNMEIKKKFRSSKNQFSRRFG